jgi:hypothetical protein
MMDLPLYPDGFAPRPPDEVEIETVELVVYPDRRRVFLHVAVTPFLKRPNLLLTARSADGAVAAEMSVIETMHHDMEFTMHLRRPGDTAGEYSLTIDLYYESRNPPQARYDMTFVVPDATDPPAG